jgi:hypothetical protein
MSLAKRIAAKRAEQERKAIEVAEWGEGDDPLRLYSAAVTARDMDKVQRKHPNFLNNVTMGGMVDVIIEKCELHNGEKAFTLEDKAVLMGEPIPTITKVFSEVFSGVDVEDHLKN